MKFIGQHIYDLVSRFRNDVYLENVPTGTIASGAHLGLDSNNKIVKAVDGGGDITSVLLTAPVSGGIDITSVSGATGGDYAAAFSVDVSDFMSSGTVTRVLTASGEDTMQAEPYFTFRNNSNNSTLALFSNEDTGDFFNIVTTTHGATTLSTVDYDATAAHFKIAADGDILLEPATGDLTMYNARDDGNPTISLGSSATNRFEIKTGYNSGAQTLDEVYFSTYTTSSTTNDGRYIFEVDEVELGRFLDGGMSWLGNISCNGHLKSSNPTTSSATEGGKLQLQADDGAAMGDDHRLGVIEFLGAEDASATRSIGARIQAICRDAWDSSNNDADLEFYTTDGTTESKVLTLDADKLATFTGAATITGLTTLSGNLTFDSVALTGIQASGETFSDDDVSLMTSAAIDDKINTKYSTSYITFSVKTSGTYGTNYILLHSNGISGGLVNVDSGVDSAGDFGGVTTEEGGSGTDATCDVATGSLEQQIPIPETCKLMGFYATTTTTTNTGAAYDTGVAIWHVPEANVNWGASTAGAATLIHKSDSSRHAENTAHSGNNRKKVQKVERMGGTAKTLAAGDILIPSVFGETSNQQITATITLVIATPIKTI